MYDANFYADLQLEEEGQARAEEKEVEQANNDYQQSVMDRQETETYNAECHYAPSEPSRY